MPLRSITDHSILLVEDNEDDALLVQRSMRRAGANCGIERLVDGAAAVRYLAGEGEFADRNRFPLPSLILLDLKLPLKNGFEVLAWIRAQPGLRRIPVVVLTSSKEDADLKRAYDLGANSYLVKRIGMDATTELIQTLGLYWLAYNERPSIRP